MPWSYASRDSLKARLGDAITVDDAIYRAVLEAVSQAIDRRTGHSFRTSLETRYYSPDDRNWMVLDKGLLAVTSLKTDSASDRAYATAWASADYDLWPPNATAGLRPYTEIRIAPLGTKAFWLFSKSTQVVGKWGFYEDLFTTPSSLTAGVNASVVTIPVTAGTDFEVLQTILADSEQMYIAAISANNLTVERAVNGTAAAAHDSGAAIKRYRYPGPIVEATVIQAARLFKRKEAPFGIVGGTDMQAARTIPSLDPDVERLLAPYIRRMMVMT